MATTRSTVSPSALRRRAISRASRAPLQCPPNGWGQSARRPQDRQIVVNHRLNRRRHDVSGQPVGMEDIERLILSQRASELQAVESTAVEIAMEKEQRGTRASGLNRDERLPKIVLLLVQVADATCNGRACEQRRDRQAFSTQALDAADQADREKRMSADVEKIIIGLDVVADEQVPPKQEQLMLERRDAQLLWLRCPRSRAVRWYRPCRWA